MFTRKNKQKQKEISLDEILLDASNLPSFHTERLEGHIEKPLTRRSVYAVGAIFVVVALIFIGRLSFLQVLQGEAYAAQSAENVLQETPVIAERGVVYDRRGETLAWNELDEEGRYDFPVRTYADREGLGQIIGYVSYPQKDSAGFYYRNEYIGISGVEGAYNDHLQGENGKRLVEATARGEIISEGTVDEAIPGAPLTLSIDAELSEMMYELIATSTETLGFRSGGGAIMDVETGELLALTSYPSYDPEVMSDGDDADKIAELNNDDRFPFLNKVIGGAYTPGSIVKPFIAYGALTEGIISPEKIIVSNGSISVPNPYDPSHPSVFKDWRVQGPMTMRDAIAYSSNVYFYTIGGGFQGQEGLGIENINTYMNLFQIGQKTGIPLGGEVEGVIPNPAWKSEVFDEDWRLGDTYHTAIGQFGFLATPLQMLRAYGAIANGGTLVVPQIERGARGERTPLHLNQENLRVVQEGMRRTVIQSGGTARALERNDVHIAAKSGTAELGVGKDRVNSWVTGYFPYEHPKYVFILFMENGPRENMVGASSIMGKVFQWLSENRPEYFQNGELSND